MDVKNDQISLLVADGMNGLQQLLTSLSDRNPSAGATVVEAMFVRFKVWAGSLGAHHASGSRSLQYRLRDASSIRTLLISLLEDLKSIVVREALPLVWNGCIQRAEREYSKDLETEELTAYFDDEDDDNDEAEDALDDHGKELSQVLSQIGGVIDCLLRLSVTISNPAPHDRFKSRAGGQIEYYEPWDFQHVLAKFPHIDKKLAERLGRALTQRRKYFKYREDHHCRLKQGLDDDGDVVSKGRATTLASSVPLSLKDTEHTSLQLDLGILDDDRSELSATSYAPSTVDQSELRVPPIPKEYIAGPFLCPFCFVFITVETRHEWKKHVFRDLRPYVCLTAACVAADQDFERRKDWTRHMSQEHWRQWACPFGCDINPPSPSNLRRHLAEFHMTVITAKSIDSIISQSSKADLQQSHGNCPLCNYVEIKSHHQYQSHVGHHLEQLALFVLPSHGHDSEGEEEGEGPNRVNDTEEEDELSTQGEDKPVGIATSYWSPAQVSEFPNLLERLGPDWLSISRHLKDKTETMVINYVARNLVENPQWKEILDSHTVMYKSQDTAPGDIKSTDIPDSKTKPGKSSDDLSTGSQTSAGSEIQSLEQEILERDYQNEDGPGDHGASSFDRDSLSGNISSGLQKLDQRASYQAALRNAIMGFLNEVQERGPSNTDLKSSSLATGEEVHMNEDLDGDELTRTSLSEELADEEIKGSMDWENKNLSPGDLMKDLPKTRRARTSKPKVKTGCNNCKQRRIKCDEERPACTQCVRSKKECSGYPQPPRSAPVDYLTSQHSVAARFDSHGPRSAMGPPTINYSPEHDDHEEAGSLIRRPSLTRRRSTSQDADRVRMPSSPRPSTIRPQPELTPSFAPPALKRSIGSGGSLHDDESLDSEDSLAEDAPEKKRNFEEEDVTKWKLGTKKEREDTLAEYLRLSREHLLESGLPEVQVDAVVSRKDFGLSHLISGPAPAPPPVSVNDALPTTTRTTYTRMARRQLSLEALRAKSIGFELDTNPDYVIINRWVPPEEQKELWWTTKAIRDSRKPELNVKAGGD